MPSEDVGVPADAARLTALYEEHGLRLQRFVLGVLQNREAAEDVVQATFARAAEVGGDIQFGAMKSWLYRVALNEAIDWRRRACVERKANLRLRETSDTTLGEGPRESLVRQETVQQVRQAIQALSLSRQRVVRARVYEEKKFAQIAAEMDVPLPTVITHMRRALEKLREYLDRPE